LDSRMNHAFQKIRFKPDIVRGRVGKWFLGGSGMSDYDTENAARHYLSELFRQDERCEIRALADDTNADRAPLFRLVNIQEQPGLNTRIVKFVETKNSIPIFGSNVVVELGQNRELVSINGQLTRVDDVDSVPKISDRDALQSLQEYTKSLGLRVAEPEKNFYLDGNSKWRLVYHFRDVPIAPPESEETPDDHAFGDKRFSFASNFDYLVDANDGSVVESYRSKYVDNETASSSSASSTSR
jgi:Zn-dependent metalloprotease